MIKGYLRKENSAGKWQKRWFEVVGRFFVYYKRADSPSMLCAMDLWKAHTPESEFSAETTHTSCSPLSCLPRHVCSPHQGRHGRFPGRHQRVQHSLGSLPFVSS